MIGIGLLLDAAELTGLVIMLEEVLMMEFFIGDDLSLTILVILGVIDLQRFVSVLHRLLFDDLILAELKWFLQSQVCHTGDHFLLADHEVGVGTTDWVAVTIINYWVKILHPQTVSIL